MKNLKFSIEQTENEWVLYTIMKKNKILLCHSIELELIMRTMYQHVETIEWKTKNQ